MLDNGGILLLCVHMRWLLQSFHTLMQYIVSWAVFFGTALSLIAIICWSVTGAAYLSVGRGWVCVASSTSVLRGGVAAAASVYRYRVPVPSLAL